MIANDNSIIIIVIIIATVLSLSLLLSLLLLLYLTNHTAWCGHHMSTHNSSITSADIQGWTAWLGMALSSLCHGWHSLSILDVRTLRDGNHLTCHSFSILVNHPTMKAQHSQTPTSWTSFSNSSHLNSWMNYLMPCILEHTRRIAKHRLHLGWNWGVACVHCCAHSNGTCQLSITARLLQHHWQT